MSKNETRITAFIEEELAKKFTELTRRIGISGTALLSRTVPAELNYLAELPANSERAEKVVRFLADLKVDEDDTPPKKPRRFNVTLRREDAKRLDQLCREKGVRRDGFIYAYIDFLVNGADGVCEAPLKKISEILMNPRHEYEEKRRNGPTADRTLYDLEDESFTVIQGVPKENPYSLLHLGEEDLNRWERLIRKNRTPENL